MIDTQSLCHLIGFITVHNHLIEIYNQFQWDFIGFLNGYIRLDQTNNEKIAKYLEIIFIFLFFI